MNAILDDSTLDNSEKEIEYEQAINNYSAYMKKAEQQQQPLATTAFPMPDYAKRPLLNTKLGHQTITRPRRLPIPDEEGEWGTMQDILNLPYEPKEKDLKNVLDLPPLADHHYEDDSGDENHMENFVSLSDDEDTVKEKHARAEHRFRKRVAKKEEQKETRSKKPYGKKRPDH